MAFPKLIGAVERAEGNLLQAVRCSLPTTADRDEALDITCRSAVHALADFVLAHDPEGFVRFWSARWAPRGAENDPTDLNANWPVNVTKGWLRA